MAAIGLKPVPPKGGLGAGFWIDLKAAMTTAMSSLSENDTTDASSDFDQTTTTVSEFMTAVDSMITNIGD